MSPFEPSLSRRIIRIPRSNDPQSYVLLQVSRAASVSLDLDIVATEGENPYTGTVRQNILKTLRAKNYQGSHDEWVQIISYVFGQLKDYTKISGLVSDIESSANVLPTENGDTELVITIRKRVQSITQRLGSVTLRQDDEQAIQLFDWSGMAVARADALEQHLSSLNDRYSAAEDTIKQLSKQLKELVDAKSQHDEQLMACFVQLLNGKKLKIRSQQRLLAAAEMDPRKISEIQETMSGKRHPSRRNARITKRSVAEMTENDSESDDGFEKMDVDPMGKQDRRREDLVTDDEQPSTPQPLEDEGIVTTDEDLSSPSVLKKRNEGMRTSSEPKSLGHASLPDSTIAPPRRELPFVRRTKLDTKSTSARLDSNGGDTAGNAAEEMAGETDDDEL
ncbi:uncharacterized protein ACLA_000750 [Aspergillus clavatus NRRL 1]|uniref:DNA repair protein XRCC4 n=1 Tax=Aspergillus clavatus (strain ATCC 1007 / CBS 513.65 / DSM 816 / NCTC 3887 / NRRL 1 / QM 1276 / 107) TaxID=344612 RepID=A1C4P6_ASPCL|nr:uncharacterized protein ACLA_000750 [Aspergillus clavatus NRRL 1]EAW14664.1 conserved hypothetical protein [Aspergillus clavatus NRRL 1]